LKCRFAAIKRTSYPIGFFTKRLDGGIDDPQAGIEMEQEA